ncbi:MAG: hypothetical protein AUI36_41375 [Cyanobacteria bacterium 13_1_40CM_2_61_4]|nr:MAG: hypothetical protein AUI36_41375 [Cyanobacteria bacterium 13_1_40CM_2_61_4]
MKERFSMVNDINLIYLSHKALLACFLSPNHRLAEPIRMTHTNLHPLFLRTFLEVESFLHAQSQRLFYQDMNTSIDSLTTQFVVREARCRDGNEVKVWFFFKQIVH